MKNPRRFHPHPWARPHPLDSRLRGNNNDGARVTRDDVKQSQIPAVAQQLAETNAKIKNRCETKPIRKVFRILHVTRRSPMVQTQVWPDTCLTGRPCFRTSTNKLAYRTNYGNLLIATSWSGVYIFGSRKPRTYIRLALGPRVSFNSQGSGRSFSYCCTLFALPKSALTGQIA
jgi:hypothetical protein